MRTNKPAILWSIVVSLSALAISLLLHCHGEEYYSNLFAGIFASGVLTVMISVINYRVEREKTLGRFYSYAQKAVNNFNCFEDEGDLERSIDSILRMNEFDYLELDNAFGDISFIFHDKETRKYIYEAIYEPTLNLRHLIADKCFHFREYRKVINGNSRVMRSMVNEVASALMEYKNYNSIDEYGLNVVIKTSRNKIVEQMRAELDGRYFEIMYPHAKKEKKDAH